MGSNIHCSLLKQIACSLLSGSVLDDERKRKKENEGRLGRRPSLPSFFFPRQIFACAVLVERLEQAIQLTASTPEMSTGYLDFSVQLVSHQFVCFNALCRFCRIVRGIIIHLRNTKHLRKRKLLLKKLQSESYIFFL